MQWILRMMQMFTCVWALCRSYQLIQMAERGAFLWTELLEPLDAWYTGYTSATYSFGHRILLCNGQCGNQLGEQLLIPKR